MKKYRNESGCEMNFDDEIPQEEIEKRLKWLGSNCKWIEITEKKEE